jgi:MSHA biogenesis protein MshP
VTAKPSLRLLCLPRALAAQSGFAVIAAIAILVILAALGAFILSVTMFRDQSTGLDRLGIRALNVARAGIEWGMYQVQHPEDPPAAAAPADCSAFPHDFPAPTFDGPQGIFAVTVTCALTGPVQESGNDIRIYTINAVACNDPNAAAPLCPHNASSNPAYVERSITVQTETCRVPPANNPC